MPLFIFKRYPWVPALSVVLLLGISSSINWHRFFVGHDHVTMWMTQYDKHLHVFIFTLLSLFSARAFKIGMRPQPGRGWALLTWVPAYVRWALYISLVCSVAVLDEFHQAFTPGRSVDIEDIYANFAGIACGLLAHYLLLKIIGILYKTPTAWQKHPTKKAAKNPAKNSWID